MRRLLVVLVDPVVITFERGLSSRGSLRKMGNDDVLSIRLQRAGEIPFPRLEMTKPDCICSSLESE